MIAIGELFYDEVLFQDFGRFEFRDRDCSGLGTIAGIKDGNLWGKTPKKNSALIEQEAAICPDRSGVF